MNAEPPYRVLVVDDHPANRLLVQGFLEPLGCEVVTAGDGLACLEAVQHTPPDLILLDVMMPGMDGFEVCRQLKGDRERRHIPVVMLTALDSPADRVRGIEAGADDFVSKPFNRHELMARVKSLLRVKRLEEHERLHMRSTLERYLDRTVAQELLEASTLAMPGGTRIDASVLFADLRDFTAWAERTPPEAVVEVLNLFLSQAVASVFRHGGMVDKFTGDGLMAIFGAPVAHPDHPRRAVAAALEIAQATPAIAHPHLGEPLRVGCGITSGDMVVGNIGSEQRLDFTAIGDTVNVAKRLCDEAPGGQVWIAAATHCRLGSAETTDLHAIHLRHRQEPVRAFVVQRLA